jgi:diguanylate cyclase (GGDEF)-like protein
MTDAAAQSPGLIEFARAWHRAVSGTSYVAMDTADAEALLRRLAARLAGGLLAEPFDETCGYQVGVDLVTADFAAPEALGRTVQVIDDRLLDDLGLVDRHLRRRLPRLVGALTAGYCRALRDRTLDEQEAIRRAALVAREQAEQALRASEARFRHDATHDSLTGLPNRALFADRLARTFDCPRPGARLGVCFLDLDGFKAVNDRLGHHIGDQLLVAVADRLGRRITGSRHLLARLGGDEFVILVEETTCIDDAVKVADEALSTFTEPVCVNGYELPISASIGIVERPLAGTDPADVMRAAGITLHWAKADGKRRLALFDPLRNAREVARYALSSAMPAAIDRREFVLAYQPLVSLTDGAVHGVEALVRWHHPELGTLTPDRFIGLAEETGVIVPLGAHVLERACRQASHWQAMTPRAPFVSVNLAVRQIRHPGLIANVATVLGRAGLPPHRLQLEITESAVMGTDDETVHTLKTLADMGVRIAIDDFGTGYSNLAYLRSLPVHELKLAGRFVEGLRSPTAADPVDMTILATLVALAHTLGLTVTAEGVETAQAERLRDIGCDTGQGWYLGRPGDPDAITRLVTAHSLAHANPPTLLAGKGGPGLT